MSSTKKTNITLTLAISATLTTVAILPDNIGWIAAAEAAESQEDREFNAWAHSNPQYSYNDAEVLARYWGKATAYEAKLKIGGLLLSGNNAGLQQALIDARKQ